MTSVGRRRAPTEMEPNATRSQRAPSWRAPNATAEIQTPRYRPPWATADGPKGLRTTAAFQTSTRCW
eukprot:1320595-Lingulodinium_polyedra.AAC.1